MSVPGDGIVPSGLPFEALTAEEFAAAARRLRRVSLAPDQTLFRHGDLGDAMYVVISGELHVRPGIEDAGPPIAKLGPGAMVGEVGLLAGVSRSATIVATTDVELWEIDRDGLVAAVQAREPWSVELLLAIARGLARRVSRVDRQLAELMADARSTNHAPETAKVAELEDLRRRLFTEWTF